MSADREFTRAECEEICAASIEGAHQMAAHIMAVVSRSAVEVGDLRAAAVPAWIGCFIAQAAMAEALPPELRHAARIAADAEVRKALEAIEAALGPDPNGNPGTQVEGGGSTREPSPN